MNIYLIAIADKAEVEALIEKLNEFIEAVESHPNKKVLKRKMGI